jgi:hypothetical protein
MIPKAALGFSAMPVLPNMIPNMADIIHALNNQYGGRKPEVAISQHPDMISE